MRMANPAACASSWAVWRPLPTKLGRVAVFAAGAEPAGAGAAGAGVLGTAGLLVSVVCGLQAVRASSAAAMAARVTVWSGRITPWWLMRKGCEAAVTFL